MNLKLQHMLALLILLLVSSFTFAQETSPKVFEESFEYSTLPDGWVQEKVFGNIDWVVESGDLQRPAGTVAGEKRLAFRNNTNQTTGAITRLITPVFDISVDKVLEPILCFAHAQAQWSNNFDTLKIFYRTNVDKPWSLLKVYDESYINWHRDTIFLPGATSTYQIAFEATDNLGRGIVIDDVEVRAMPNCIIPYSVFAMNLEGENVTIGWGASYDAKYFHIKIDTLLLSPADLNNQSHKASIVDTLISNDNGREFFYDKYNFGKTYYVYIKSICQSEESGWSEVYSFTTPIKITLPHKENFNMEYKQKVLGETQYWAYQAQDASINRPFVNILMDPTYDLKKYTEDATTALCFMQCKFEQWSIRYLPYAKSLYALAITPELDVDDIRTVEIGFNTINPMFETDLCQLIVGVMNDQQDKSKFVPVDTVVLRTYNQFERHFVSFENYTGKGKYIAFLSEFNETNQFVLDDLEIRVSNGAPGACIYVKQGGATEVNVEFESTSEKYEVIFSQTEITDFDNYNKSNVISFVVNENNALIEGLPESTMLYVYGRHINGDIKGPWSSKRKIRTHKKIQTLPSLIDFTMTEDNSYIYYALKGTYSFECSLIDDVVVCENNTEWKNQNRTRVLVPGDIMLGTTVNEGLLFARTDINGYSNWVSAISRQILAFPELLDRDNTSVSFQVYNYDGSYNGRPVNFYVGFLNDLNDVNSFSTIDSVQNIYPNGEGFYTYDLSKYPNAEGKFFAIMLKVGQMAYIDNVKFFETPKCETPTNVNLTYDQNDATKIYLSWDANGVSEWDVCISKHKYTFDEMMADDFEGDFVFAKTVTQPNVEFSGLNSDGYRYYYYLRSSCNGGLDKGLWTLATEFYTLQPEKIALPYVMNFDRDDWQHDRTKHNFPIASLFTEQIVATELDKKAYAPFVWEGMGVNSSSALYLYAHKIPTIKRTYIVFPELDATELASSQISFYAMSNSELGGINVALASDPNNIADPDKITNLITVQNIDFVDVGVWHKYIVPFSKLKYPSEYKYVVIMSDVSEYTGEYGKYDFFIDNVVIDKEKDCVMPQNIKIIEARTSDVLISWDKNGTKTWKVVLSEKQLSDEQLNLANVASDDVVFVENVTSNQLKIDNLTPSTDYYFYIQAICGEDAMSDWSVYNKFTTTCVSSDLKDLTVEDFETEPACYILGCTGSPRDKSLYIPKCDDEYAIGNQSLLLHSNIEGADADQELFSSYAMMPSLNLEIGDWANMRVVFSATSGKYTTNLYSSNVTVGIVTNPYDLTTFIPIETIKLDSQWKTYEVRFETYDGDWYGGYGNRVCFLSDFNDGENFVWIDDVLVDTISACDAPLINVEEIKSESITLSLLGKQSMYELAYSLNDFNLENPESYTVKVVNVGESFTIDNLVAASDYYFVARAICAENTYSDWGKKKLIQTTCYDKLPLPYLETFENNKNTGLHSQPLCWYSYFTNQSYATAVPYVEANAFSGKGVRLFNASVDPVGNAKASKGLAYFASPVIDVENITDIELSFQLKVNKGSYDSVYAALVVAVCENVENLVAYVPIDTIYQWSYENFKEHIVYFDNYVGNAKHIELFTIEDLSIAWLNASNKDKAGKFYRYADVTIDNISIDYMHDCKKPTDIKIKYVEDVKMAFSFDYETNATFEVKYGPRYFNLQTEGSVRNFNTSNIVVDGLIPLTEYDFYVRAKCSNDEFSSWSYVGVIETSESYVSNFPYVCDFEDTAELDNWGFKNEEQPNMWVFGDAISFGNTGNALYISNDNGANATYKYMYDRVDSLINSMTGLKEYIYTGSISNSFAYRLLNLTQGTYNISFDWMGEADGMSDYMKVFLVPLNQRYIAGSNKLGKTVINHKQLVNDKIIDISETIMNGKKRYYFSGANDWNRCSNSVYIDSNHKGIYGLVFYWTNDQENGSGKSIVIDNVSVIKSNCSLVKDIELTEVTTNSATLSWFNSANKYRAIVLDTLLNDVTTAESEHIIYDNELNTSILNVTGLTELTTYYLYVQAQCSTNNLDIWSSPFEFETKPNPIGIGTIIDFESDKVYYRDIVGNSENTKYPMIKGLIFNHPTSKYDETNVDYFPYIVENGIYNTYEYINSKNILKQRYFSYARSGSHALYSYASSIPQIGLNTVGSYVVLPVLKDEEQKRELSFWLRTEAFKDGALIVPTSLVADPIVVVGLMSDPNDINTFVELETVTYPIEIFLSGLVYNENDDADSTNYWRRFVVPLIDASGKHIAFRFDGMNGSSAPVAYIDDIEITEQRECITPVNFELINLKSNAVTVSSSMFDADELANIYVATDELFANVVKSIENVKLPYVVDGLNEGTNYCIAIQRVCADNAISDLSKAKMIFTNHSSPYSEIEEGDFDVLDGIPMNWTRAFQYSEAYYASSLLIKLPPNEDLFNVLRQPLQFPDNLNIGWEVTKEPLKISEKFSTRSIFVPYNNQYRAHQWLISPSVELIGNQQGNYHLTFNASVSNYDTYLPINPNADLVSSEFLYVVVSTDNGQTWDIENGVLWCDSIEGARKYTDIDYKGEVMRVDLSRYAGQTIKVAFVHNGISCTCLNINDVRVNAYLIDEINEDLCQTEDYQDDFCFVSADQLVVGDNSFDFVIQSEIKTHEPDILHNVNINLLPMVEKEITDVMCQGDVYEKYGFSGIVKEGVYRLKYISSNGCDSIVTLNLFVNPSVEVMFFDTICSGYMYEWGELILSETGIYTQIFKNEITGCDSTVILSLYVKDPIIENITEVLCFGEKYLLGDIEISNSGTYTETFKTPAGCDSIVNLTIIARPDYRYTETVSLCYGEAYEGDIEGFVGLSETGVYTLPYTSIDGCDSTIVLKLTILSGDTTFVEDTISTADLPYQYESLYFDDTTLPGIYCDTIEVESQNGDCSSVVIYTLTVIEATPIDNVRILDLLLIPNPVKTDQILHVGGEFTIEEQNGLVIEIYDAIGQRVYYDIPKYYPLQLSGLIQRGVYLVKVTTGNGSQYQGKVIVE